LGRPKGKPVEKYSLRPIGDYLHSLIHQPVIFSHDTIGRSARENRRTYARRRRCAPRELEVPNPGKKQTIRILPKRSPSLGDLYVNDAFGAAHRAHASTVGITKFVDKSATGFLMEKELKHLRDGLENPAKPFVVILGGSKVSDKIGVFEGR